jgi:type IV pilus assembly protein PilF
VQRYLAVNAPSAEILWLGFRTQRKLGDTPGAIAFGRRIQTEFPDSEQAQQLRAGVDR